jgi:hypothetical protein
MPRSSTDDATSSGSGRGSATAFAGYRFTMDFAVADAAPVPEPASLLILGTGLAGVFGDRRASGKRRARSGGSSREEQITAGEASPR